MSVKRNLAVLAAGVLALTAVCPAGAATVDQRQSAQRSRIARGLCTGELTAGEAARLRREQAEVRALEIHERRDGGVFTPAERARVQRALDRASRHIARESHDARRR